MNETCLFSKARAQDGAKSKRAITKRLRTSPLPSLGQI
jgi:hypothetical protein